MTTGRAGSGLVPMSAPVAETDDTGLRIGLGRIPPPPVARLNPIRFSQYLMFVREPLLDASGGVPQHRQQSFLGRCLLPPPKLSAAKPITAWNFGNARIFAFHNCFIGSSWRRDPRSADNLHRRCAALIPAVRQCFHGVGDGRLRSGMDAPASSAATARGAESTSPASCTGRVTSRCPRRRRVPQIADFGSGIAWDNGLDYGADTLKTTGERTRPLAGTDLIEFEQANDAAETASMLGVAHRTVRAWRSAEELPQTAAMSIPMLRSNSRLEICPSCRVRWSPKLGASWSTPGQAARRIDQFDRHCDCRHRCPS